jgi:hypothetical protein
MATFKDDHRRVEFEGASFYIDVQSDEMMGGKTAHVYACSLKDHGIVDGMVGGRIEPDAPEYAGSDLIMNLLETIEERHYADIDRTVYHGIAGPSVKERLRPADLWMEWLGIEGEYTPQGIHLTTVRVDKSDLTPEDLDQHTVQRILDSAALRLSQGLQNMSAELDVAEALARYANVNDAVPEDTTRVLRKLRKKLNARENGWDLGVGAVDARGPTGEDWWSVGP